MKTYLKYIFWRSETRNLRLALQTDYALRTVMYLATRGYNRGRFEPAPDETTPTAPL